MKTATALLAAALMLASWPAAAHDCHCSHRHSGMVRQYYRGEPRSERYYYRQPYDDFGTTFYGENGGTVHYGF
jgi:hypothetical protein